MATIPITTINSRRVKPRVCMDEDESTPALGGGSKYATIPPSTKRNWAKVARFLVGVDIGGTFTDCVVLGHDGRITATKAPSTPGNFAEGMIAAMRVAAKRLIEGVSERVDCFGEVVVALNEAEAEAAIRRLLDAGVEAIGVCFLWSFKYPQHERRVTEMIAGTAPR